MKLFFPVQQQSESCKTRSHSTAEAGFSLVEIVLAIGVVSFALLGIVGTLPVGIGAVQDAMVQVASANILREVRGEVQQISFNTTDSTAAYNISDLSKKTYYYTQDGMSTDIANAYYRASFDVSASSVSEAGGGDGGGFTFTPSNARNITVTLRYPQFAPEANQKKAVFSFLAAKQKSN